MERPKDIPADANILYDVETSNGKYRFVIIEDQPPRAYRLGQPWQAFSNVMLGSGAIYSLIAALSECQRPGTDETSAEIASLAGEVLNRDPLPEGQSHPANAYNRLLEDAKRLAGSALSQREP